MCEISEPTYIKIKDLILDVIGSTANEVVKIGGEGQRVQVDETAICNGLIITDPSNSLDNIHGIQWIVGGVVEGNCKEFFVKLVPNRKWETMLEVFIEHILPGTDIVTDGYPSYPRAVFEFGSYHEVVNHTLGFINETGGNTNQIENLRSHLKHDYRGRSGINHERIVLWLEEFSWKKNIEYAVPFSVIVGFVKLICKFAMLN